jgi:hypothetical protein
MSKLKLGAFWKPRRESIEQCADRLQAFMAELVQCDEVFASWYQLGRSRKDALRRKIDVHDRRTLLTLLNKGRNRRDYGGEVIEDLGFRVGLWNGGPEERMVGLSIGCGLYSKVFGLGANSVVLGFPEELGALADASKTSRVLAITARCWEPDWAGVFSVKAMQTSDWSGEPVVGWMIYLPRKIERVPTPSTVAQLDKGGSLIIVQPDPPSLDNPEDLERIRRVEEIARR